MTTNVGECGGGGFIHFLACFYLIMKHGKSLDRNVALNFFSVVVGLATGLV